MVMPRCSLRASALYTWTSKPAVFTLWAATSKAIRLVLNCDSEEQLRDFYAKLVDGGKEVFAPTDSGWGAIIAHCTDQFGVTDELRQAAELAVGDVTRMSDPWPIGALPSEKVRCTIELGKRPKNRMTQIFAHGISGNSQRDGNLLNRFALCR